MAGDQICSLRHHGGDDQAVYAVAREDLDDWERELGRPLANGVFGENFTTSGLDVSGALIGERWRIGSELVLEVTSGRIPCRTFQGHVGEKQWVKRFMAKGAPGAYLRVIEPGEIRAGDSVEIIHRPDHDVTVALQFRAVTTDRKLLPRLLAMRRGAAPGVAGGGAQVRCAARRLTHRHRQGPRSPARTPADQHSRRPSSPGLHRSGGPVQ